MKKNNSKFFIVGLMAVATAFVAGELLNSPNSQEYNTILTKVIQKEQLNVTPKISLSNIYQSNASLILTPKGSQNTLLNFCVITTNALKIMALISALKASTRGVYDFTALHEYSHAQYS